jgi:DNA-binding NarL/FixJ family response regulator
MVPRRPANSNKPPPPGFQVPYWRRRLFKNTFTRDGQRTTLKGWSVKIQHQGRRRTFSLTASNRSAAAREAWEIYQTIVSPGPGAATPRHSGINPKPASAPPRTAARSLSGRDADVWKPRLLHRKYLEFLHADVTEEFSVQVEHAGTSQYFRLGTGNAERAVARAVEIHRTVVRRGWETAKERFSRELTVAFRWSDNPVRWTYTTLHTQASRLRARLGDNALGDSLKLKVAIIESDAGIRHALAGIVNRHAGFRCTVTFESTAEALKALPCRRAHLLLVNHGLANRPGVAWQVDLPAIAPKVATLLYSVYEDSDQLFASVPGGAIGYFLKRLPPGRSLEPVAELAGKSNLASDELAACTLHYFRRLLLPVRDSGQIQELSKLTQREQEVLSLLSKGYLDKSIADTLRISIWTVHGHVKNIFQKLNVHTRIGAVLKFLQK